MSSNWKNWFLGSGGKRELKDTLALLQKCKEAPPIFASYDEEHQFILDFIFEVCERRGVTPSLPLGNALYWAVKELFFYEGILIELPSKNNLQKLTLEEGVFFRSILGRYLRFANDRDRLLSMWREKLVWTFSGMLEYFPPSAFTDIDAQGVAFDDSVVLPDAHAYDLCDNLPEALDRLIITFADEDVIRAHLFDPLWERFENNAFSASGIPVEKRRTAGAKMLLPSENRRIPPKQLVEIYLRGTPFLSFFERPLPFAIPFPARFEHTHIVGGTGHGKTQLMQFLINHDLVRAMEDGRSVVVIDSQGDLIRTISHLACWSPSADKSLGDRFVLVDPNDIEHPACLNMFDFNRDRLSGYSAVDREKILNATVELYEYFFGALLGADLTQRQGLIFKYLARLLIEIPDATIHTMRELMEDGERFRPYMEQLTGTTRSFFATRFFDKSFNETKKQVLTRLWGVLSNSSLERMFSHSRNKIDMFELINSGKIILINTAKDLLGQEGAAIFGRFFIALIAQAAIQRAALLAHERTPCFVYIDEAQDYFDQNIEHLLTQARKYRVGLIFAHQNLDQLGAGLRSSVLSSTSIKFAGGLSVKDAHGLAPELRCDAEFLLSQKKQASHTEFACYVRNYTGRALSVNIPLGYVDALPILDPDEYDLVIEKNRRRYTEPPELPEDIEFPTKTSSARRQKITERSEPNPPVENVAPPAEPIPQSPDIPDVTLSGPAAPKPSPEIKKKKAAAPKETVQAGRGGQQHKYLQHLVKQLAEERGFRASIEESILDGTGQVDVSLTRGKLRIACEISVTTNRDQELGNIEKCLAAGYKEVLLLGSNERHLKSLAKFIELELDETERGKVLYVSPDTLITHLDSLGGPPPTTEQTVRGYKVRTVQSVVDPEEADARRKAVAGVIARSLKNARE